MILAPPPPPRNGGSLNDPFDDPDWLRPEPGPAVGQPPTWPARVLVEAIVADLANAWAYPPQGERGAEW